MATALTCVLQAATWCQDHVSPVLLATVPSATQQTAPSAWPPITSTMVSATRHAHQEHTRMAHPVLSAP